MSTYEYKILHNDPMVEYYDVIQELPSREQTILDLYYNKKMDQEELAKIFGITQGAISHKIARIKERLVYLSELKKIDFKKIFKDIKGFYNEIIADPFDILVLQSLVKTSCQSETAWQLNNKYGLKLNQIKVKHIIERLANKLKRKRKYKEHYKAIKKVMNNLYILHEIKLPHFDRSN
jgi:predicted DNA-binding protein YlxM (UPF0122 family)